MLKRYARRRGTARLAALIHTPSLGDSKAAQRLHRHLLRSGLAKPLVDHRIGRWRPDFYFPETKLAVEVDGGEFHASRPRLERDHRKDIEPHNQGIEVLRFTGRQVNREFEFVLVAIARAYERRRVEDRQLQAVHG